MNNQVSCTKLAITMVDLHGQRFWNIICLSKLLSRFHPILEFGSLLLLNVDLIWDVQSLFGSGWRFFVFFKESCGL